MFHLFTAKCWFAVSVTTDGLGSCGKVLAVMWQIGELDKNFIIMHTSSEKRKNIGTDLSIYFKGGLISEGLFTLFQSAKECSKSQSLNFFAILGGFLWLLFYYFIGYFWTISYGVSLTFFDFFFSCYCFDYFWTIVLYGPRTTDAQWRHKSKKPEILGRCGRKNMLRLYL